MTLLCCSILALLLLPLSLSCKSKRLPQEVRRDYELVKTDLHNSRQSITTLLQNSSCPELRYKLRHCASPNNTDFVSTLRILTCKMKRLKLSYTDRLTKSVLYSIRCPCLEKPKKGAAAKLKEKMMARRRRPNEERQNQRKTKKLCRAKTLMAALTECYEMLNAQGSMAT